MNPIVDEAFKRALIIAAATFLVSVGGLMVVPDLEWRYIIGASIGPAVGSFMVRVIGEGWYDTNRAARGDAIAGDVPVASKKLDVTTKSGTPVNP